MDDKRTLLDRRCGALLAALGLVLLEGGCLVDSQCRASYDCPSGETCQLSTGKCYVECNEDKDCTVGGLSVGKTCTQNQCRFLFDERVPAPGFCLEDINPKTSTHGTSLCLSALKNKVVLLFFGLLA
jgi:hypothetical protein